MRRGMGEAFGRRDLAEPLEWNQRIFPSYSREQETQRGALELALKGAALEQLAISIPGDRGLFQSPRVPLPFVHPAHDLAMHW